MSSASNTCRVIRRAYFSAAHRLHNDTRTFGHNYILEAHIEGPIDAQTGMVIAMHELDAHLREVTSQLDHRFLNYDVPYFKEVVPTAENVAFYCYEFLREQFAGKAAERSLRLAKVRLFETDDFWVDIE